MDAARAQKAARARALALKEAYRPVTVREGDKEPSGHPGGDAQVARAVKGNGPAQRAMIAAIHALEQELATETAAREKAAAARHPISNLEAARRIAYVVRLAYRKILGTHCCTVKWKFFRLSGAHILARHCGAQTWRGPQRVHR
jgi:hypothetical protein